MSAQPAGLFYIVRHVCDIVFINPCFDEFGKFIDTEV